MCARGCPVNDLAKEYGYNFSTCRFIGIDEIEDILHIIAEIFGIGICYQVICTDVQQNNIGLVIGKVILRAGRKLALPVPSSVLQ